MPDDRTMSAAYAAMNNPAPLTLEQKLDDALRRLAQLEQSLHDLTTHFEAELASEPHPIFSLMDDIVDALRRHDILPRAKAVPKPGTAIVPLHS